MKSLRRIKYNFFQFSTSVILILGSIYIFNHIGYLDDLRITNPPIMPGLEHSMTSFVDDTWFGIIVLIAGVVLMLGVVTGYRILADTGLIATLGIMALMAVSFVQRGVLDQYFNLTWLMALLAFAGVINELWNGRRGRGSR